MELILNHEEFEIWKDKHATFTIKFNNKAYQVINSIVRTKIISGSSTDDNYKLLKFKAESVKSLKQFKAESNIKNGKDCLLVSDVAKMIQTLSKQLSYLIHNESSTILGYNPENIIVINDEKFIFLNSELIKNFDEDTEMIMISYPLTTNDFFVSPEILKITELPVYIHYKTSYFSLGCLLLFVLSGDNEFYNEFLVHKQSLKMLNVLNNHPIKNTRIYWLLSRCLDEEAKNRGIILI